MLILALLIQLSSATPARRQLNSTSSPIITTPSATLGDSSPSGSATDSIPITRTLTIPTCNIDDGQNCDRVPEQPYYNYITPGVINYQYDHHPFDSPWLYDVETLTGSAAESATSCGAFFTSKLADYKASASITPLPYIPASVSTALLQPTTSTYLDISVLGESMYVTTMTYLDGTTVTTTFTATSQIQSRSSWTSTYPTRLVVFTEAGVTPWRYVEDFTYTATSSCCYSCTLFGGELNVYFWPTTDAYPAPSTLVNSNGFTMVHPSVYVAISSLSATDYCGPVGAAETPITMGFASTNLSTAVAYHWDTNLYPSVPYTLSYPTAFTQANWGEYSNCNDQTTTVYAVDELYSGYSWPSTATSTFAVTTNINYTIASYEMTYNLCSPYVSVPSAFSALDPLFTKCFAPLGMILSDPPYTLSAGFDLSGPTTVATQASDVITTTSAAAGSPIQSITPSMTTTSVPDPTTTTTSAIIAQTSSSSAADSGTQLSDTTTIIVVSSQDPTSISTTIIVGTHTQDPIPISTTIVASYPGLTTSTSTSVSTSQTTSSAIAIVQPTTTSTYNSPAIITFSSTALTANSASAFTFDSQTLTPGGVITHSGTTLSLATNGASVIIDKTSTQTLQAPAPTTTAPSTYLIASQTLAPGGSPITISGTTYSLQTNGQSVVIGGITTQPISKLLPLTEFLVGGQTLVAGGSAITVSGSTISLLSGGTSVIIGTKTAPLSEILGSSTTEVGVGGIIASLGGFGGSTSTATTSSSSYVQVAGAGATGLNGTVYTGKASRLNGGFWLAGMGFGLVVLGCL